MQAQHDTGPQQWWEVARAFQHGGRSGVAEDASWALCMFLSAGGSAAGSARVVSDNKFLSLVETSIQTSFPMTVKVDGVSQDATTMYIHNKVHNRTRTLTCAGVSVFDAPQSVISHECCHRPAACTHTCPPPPHSPGSCPYTSLPYQYSHVMTPF